MTVSHASKGDSGRAAIRAHARRPFPHGRNRHAGNDLAALVKADLFSIQPHIQLRAERHRPERVESGRIEGAFWRGKGDHGAWIETSDLHLASGVKLNPVAGRRSAQNAVARIGAAAGKIRPGQGLAAAIGGRQYVNAYVDIL